MLGIVIVNYKTIDETVNYIRQELIKVSTPHKIVVVDVACEDIAHAKAIADPCDGQIIESLDCQPDLEKQVYVLPHKENLGYAKGNNYGADFLRKHFKPDYFLFSNNDIKLIDDDVVERLIEKARQLPDVGAIGPRVVGLEGKDQSPRIYISIWKKYIVPYLLCWCFIGWLKNYWSNYGPINDNYCYWVIGCFFVVKADAFIKAGMFDPNTFLFSEEPILAERLIAAGYRNYFYTGVKIVHEDGAVIGGDLAWRNAMQISFNSAIYYYQRYRKIDRSTVLLAKCAFFWYHRVCLTSAKRIKAYLLK